VQVRVWGNLVAYVERLDDEMFKALQVTDPHTQQYVGMLRSEPVFLALAHKVADYLTATGDVAALPKVRGRSALV
jgi:translation initiation factor 3 subunit C